MGETLPMSDFKVALWDAVNEYAAACCGGHEKMHVNDRRMEAVVLVENVIAAELKRRSGLPAGIVEALNSGDGVYRP